MLTPFFLFIISNYLKQTKGPRGLPLVGYAPFINRHDPIYPHRAMMKLAAKYGPVTGFYMGPKQPLISVCGADAVRQVLKNEDLNARPITAALKEQNLVSSGSKSDDKVTGLFFLQGDDFNEQHRFAIRHLIDLAKPSTEDVFREEIADLLVELKEQCDSDPDGLVDFTRLFNISVINLLWAIVAGKRFQHDDIQLKRLQRGVEELFRGGNPIGASVPVPAIIFRIFPSLKKYFRIVTDIWTEMKDFIKVLHKSNDI